MPVTQSLIMSMILILLRPAQGRRELATVEGIVHILHDSVVGQERNCCT